VNEINQTRRLHVLTIEDPSEFIIPDNACMITQQEVGQHVHSFAGGLRIALRGDADVIVVGEMRDLDTISNAITAAETGHLVIGTLHTNDSVQALDRLEQASYDATIVDLQMPLLGGLDVLRTYRFGSGLGKSMPFIVLSANATPEAQRECDEAGVDAYLTKPVDPSRLLETLDSLTRGKASTQKPARAAKQAGNQPALLDPAELSNLLQLGHGVEFIDDLFEGFARDARHSIQGLETSLASQQYQQYRFDRIPSAYWA